MHVNLYQSPRGVSIHGIARGRDGCASFIIDDESEHNPSNVELGCILALHLKQEKKEIVVLAHRSGSGRQSPRNQYVASILNNASIDTLLADLLTSEEQKVDEKTREYRFNIRLLANRLVAATDWLLTKHPKT